MVGRHHSDCAAGLPHLQEIGGDGLRRKIVLENNVRLDNAIRPLACGGNDPFRPKPIERPVGLLHQKAEPVVRHGLAATILDGAETIKTDFLRRLENLVDRILSHGGRTVQQPVHSGDADARGLRKIGDGRSVHGASQSYHS
ncbi:hypothetical protein D3C86_1670050 [compost metagenome]